MSILNKKCLYLEIDKLRKKYNLNYTTVNFRDLCDKLKIQVAPAAFETDGLRGMAFKGSNFSEDVILLSDKRTECEQNIDCGHEFIHLYLQRNELITGFNCFEKIRPQQDSYFEWQANEGSAELLLPYKFLLPKINKSLFELNDWSIIDKFKRNLAKELNLTPAVVQFRLESLKYEIHQYVNLGISLENIEILSNAAQQKRNINVKSLNDIEDKNFSNMIKQWHCKKNSETTTDNDSDLPY